MLRNRRAILADDMGLGKTAQVLKMCDYAKYKRILVVCPPSLKHLWADQIEEWSGKVIDYDTRKIPNTYCIIDPGPTFSSFIQMSVRFTIIGYPTLRAGGNYLESLKGPNWDCFLFDEAHNLKNRKSKTFLGAKALVKSRKYLVPCYYLTGTPLINKVEELWPLLHLIDYTKYSSFWSWVGANCLTMVSRWSKFSQEVLGPKDAPALKRELSNVMLRRTKDEVLDLPEKTVVTLRLDCNSEQERMLKQVKKEMYTEWDGGSVDTPTALAQLTRMRQICVDPCLLTQKEMLGPKVDALWDIISGTDGQVVVFSQFATAIEELSNKDFPVSYSFFTGKTPMSERNEVIKKFASGKTKVLMCTMQCGGVGYTFANANTAVFLDYHWSPAINAQALDRLHRIGQVNKVTAYVLIMRGTVEEYVLKLLKSKNDLFNSVIPEVKVTTVFKEIINAH